MLLREESSALLDNFTQMETQHFTVLLHLPVRQSKKMSMHSMYPKEDIPLDRRRLPHHALMVYRMCEQRS